MTLFLLYTLQWVLVLVFIAVFILMCLWMWTLIRAKVPFVPVPASTLGSIYKALGITDDSVVYDLGCGDGRVLLYAAQLSPRATYIGIDNNPFALFLARMRSWWHAKRYKAIEIRKQDFFTTDLSKATHIFTYLYPSVMDDLLPKFDRELAPGTRLVSMTFMFTLKRPIAEIDLERASHKLARKLSIYEF